MTLSALYFLLGFFGGRVIGDFTLYEVDAYTPYVTFISWTAQLLYSIMFPLLLPVAALSLLSWRWSIIVLPFLVGFLPANPLLGILGILVGVPSTWLGIVGLKPLLVTSLLGFGATVLL